MRKLLLVLLLLAAAMAVDIDPETGCETYSDHVVCPQATEVEMVLNYVEDAHCFTIQNEFDALESLGCYSTAQLANDLEYMSCSMYVPFNQQDILVGDIDYEYNCVTERVAAGTNITTWDFEEHEECELIEGDEFGDYTVCPMKGKKYTALGTIAYDEGDYSFIVAEQEAKELIGADLASPVLILILVALLIYAGYVWTERKTP